MKDSSPAVVSLLRIRNGILMFQVGNVYPRMNTAVLRMPDRNRILAMLLLAVVYFVTARVGLSLYSVNNFAALIWPPTGIAFAALLLYGRDLWPGVALAAFLVNI